MRVKCELITDKNKRLKQLVKQFGRDWFAISQAQPVQCFNGCLRIRIEDITGSHNRWIKYPEEIILKENKQTL